MALIHLRDSIYLSIYLSSKLSIYYYYYGGVSGMLKDMVGGRLGVSNMEIAILALLAANLLFSIWQTRIIGLSIKQLDGNIAQALPIVIQEAVKELNVSDIVEPVNPIMQVIAEAIGKSVKSPSLEVKEISRSEDGKFS
tara:strand:+ start:1544 stop:1960 length:417 start_codon:yes stop_codon:yes gene_type:complete